MNVPVWETKIIWEWKAGCLFAERCHMMKKMESINFGFWQLGSGWVFSGAFSPLGLGPQK